MQKMDSFIRLLGNNDIQFRHIQLAGDKTGEQQIASAAEGGVFPSDVLYLIV